MTDDVPHDGRLWLVLKSKNEEEGKERECGRKMVRKMGKKRVKERRCDMSESLGTPSRVG
jgi:hypothetical protein